MNKYEQLQKKNDALSDIFMWNILRLDCFMFKYSVTESSQWNEIAARQTRTCLHDVIKVCNIEYLTTKIELVLPTFFQLLDRSQNYKIFNVRAIVYPLKYVSQYKSLLFFTHPVINMQNVK